MKFVFRSGKFLELDEMHDIRQEHVRLGAAILSGNVDEIRSAVHDHMSASIDRWKKYRD